MYTGDVEVHTLEIPSACHAVSLHMQFPLVSHFTQATQWCFQHTVSMCTVGSFWSLLNIGSWIWLVWWFRCSRRYEISHDGGLPMSWVYSKGSWISYCKCAEGQHKPDETLLNPKGLLGISVYPAGLLSGISAPVEGWAAEPPALFGRTHFTFLGGAVLPPHGRSLAEHGTRPPLHTDKPTISLQSMPKILCHMERTCVGVQSTVFCYSWPCQKIAGARQLKGVYKKLMADINIDLWTKNGYKWRSNRSKSCDLLQALWQVLIWSTDLKRWGIKGSF